MRNELLDNLDKLHSTELGIGRIRKNLGLGAEDAVLWCRQHIENANDIVREGKNWYVYARDIRITVNARSFTIITAHRGKHLPAPQEHDTAAHYTKEDLREALRAIASTIQKCEKAPAEVSAGDLAAHAARAQNQGAAYRCGINQKGARRLTGNLFDDTKGK